MGFVKEWKFGQIDQLAGKTLFLLAGGLAKLMGILWLFDFLAFVIVAAGLLMHKEWWWMVGLGAVVLSQFLIVVYWKDARAGTIVNLLVLPAVLVSWGTWSFDRCVREEVTALFASSVSNRGEVVKKEMLAGLPSPVQRWLVRSNVVGRVSAQNVRRKQKGMMRSTPEGSWMPFESQQYFTADPTGFLWSARIQVTPLIEIVARDKSTRLAREICS
jgi:hypothetical protein